MERNADVHRLEVPLAHWSTCSHSCMNEFKPLSISAACQTAGLFHTVTESSYSSSLPTPSACMGCLQIVQHCMTPLSHNRPSTQVLIPHGDVWVWDAQCGSYSAAEVVTCGFLNCRPETGPRLPCGGFPHATCNYNWRWDVSFGENVRHSCMKLVVQYRKSKGLCVSWCVFLSQCLWLEWQCGVMDCRVFTSPEFWALAANSGKNPTISIKVFFAVFWVRQN